MTYGTLYYGATKAEDLTAKSGSVELEKVDAWDIKEGYAVRLIDNDETAVVSELTVSGEDGLLDDGKAFYAQEYEVIELPLSVRIKQALKGLTNTQRLGLLAVAAAFALFVFDLVT